MPIFSYLAHPVKGAKSELISQVKALDNCEIIPADNEDILVIVTDTPDDDTEKVLWKELSGLESMQSLDMIFGHRDEQS